MSQNPFAARTEGPLIVIEIGKKTTVWLHGSVPVAFAISGYGIVKVAEIYTASVNKAIRALPAKQQLSVEEFNARLNVLAYSLDDEATRMIDRPSWSNDEQTIKDGEWIAKRTGWEI